MGDTCKHAQEDRPESCDQEKEEYLGILLDRCGHFFAHRIGCSRRGRGNIMALLAQRPGITQRELAEVLGVQPASVSELLIKLERKGFVKREKDELDRRSVHATLTEAGQEHLERPEADKSAPFRALSDQEQQLLCQLLEKLLQDWRQRYPIDQAEQRRRRQNQFLAHQQEDKTDDMEENHEI